MIEYAKEIAFAEGYRAYRQLLRTADNPYDGVSEELKRSWCDGWWDAFHGDQ